MLAEWTDLLDPRPAEATVHRAISGAATIPACELVTRLHELPRPGARVRVATVEGWEETASALESLRRIPEPCSDWSWAEVPQPYRLWSPTTWLMECVSGLEPGVALDLGCGSGREAVALAALGWQVVAVDRLPDALERGRDLQGRYAPGAPPVKWVHADLRSYDLAQASEVRPSLVCSLAYFELATLQSAWSLLAPGGTLLVECFTDEHWRRVGRPRRGRWTPWPEPSDAETWSLELAWRGDDRHTARLVARKAHGFTG